MSDSDNKNDGPTITFTSADRGIAFELSQRVPPLWYEEGRSPVKRSPFLLNGTTHDNPAVSYSAAFDTASLAMPAPQFKWGSGKSYVHSAGFSCCFRQWRAKSHCRFLHGYALRFDLQFEAQQLDENNWVQDFGSLKKVKKWLEETFDHTTLVAQDDPCISIFRELAQAKMIQLRIVEGTGCEMTAKMVYEMVAALIVEGQDRIILRSVTVREHEGNSASYSLIG